MSVKERFKHVIEVRSAFHSFQAGLERVNAWLEAYAKKSDAAVFVDCGPALLPHGQVPFTF